MTNQTLQSMLAHRSIRAYRDEPVAEEQIDLIVQAAQRAPTSINGQALSVIVVRDPVRRATIARYAGGQSWIEQAPVFLLFVIDFYKTMLACEQAGVQQIVQETAEGLLAGATDVGIALGTAIAAAESMGLGIVPIGGVRKSPQAMIELLDLPTLTFPLAGLAIGHPADRPEQKPRLGMAAFRHEESYKARTLPAQIENYDQVMERYLKEIGRDEIEANWSRRTAAFYSIIYYPEVLPVLHRQGFSFDR